MAEVDFARYRKAVVAFSGAAVVVVANVFNVVVDPGVSDAAVQLFDALVVVATAFGVKQVPNA